MQAYVLDTNFNTIDLIDTFMSFIWTDRYYGYGEFELVIPVKTSYINSIQKGRYLYRKETEHIMIVETMQVITDVEEGNSIIVSGRSLEYILHRRVIWESTELTGNFQDGIFRLLNANVINPMITHRKIPFFKYKKSEDPYILKQELELKLHGENLYDVILMICQERSIGFKITVDSNNYFVFELYHGMDRSYLQEENPWIVFSPQFENLVHTEYIESSLDLETASLVFGQVLTINEETGLAEEKEVLRDIVSKDYPFTGLSRREIAIETNVRHETIDKEELGTPEDRVDIHKYQIYEPVYFDREGWEKWQKEHPYSTLLTKEDFYEYDWVFIDGPSMDAYEQALKDAQQAIDAEYEKLVNDANTNMENDMAQAGLNELSNYKIYQSFDGELQALNQYILNRDFYIGDVVQVVNEYGLQGISRIVEIVYSHDINGDLMYPTFMTS